MGLHLRKDPTLHTRTYSLILKHHVLYIKKHLGAYNKKRLKY